MKITNLCKTAALLAASTLLFACGGGGGGASVGTVVNGVARAGVFTKGTAVFQGYSGAQKNKQYRVGFTNFSSPTGAFQCNIGSYSGPLRVDVSGTYKDEATGKLVTVTPDSPLKAALPQSAVSNGVTVPVTPLTDIAAAKAIAAGFSDASINLNNQGVAKLFGLTDVTKTIPVLPTVANLSATTVTPEQTYAVALVKLSSYVAQYAATASGTTTSTVTSDSLQTALPDALAQLSQGITVSAGTGTSTTPTVAITAPDVLTTLTTLMSAPVVVDNTTVTVPAATVTSLTSAVTTAGSTLNVHSYKVLVSGPAAGVYGLQVTLTVPAGVTISADANGVVSVSAVTSAVTGGVVDATLKADPAVSGQNLLKLTYVSGTPLLSDGAQLATIISSVSSTAPALTAGTVTALDKNGSTVSGITVTVQ